MKRFLSVLLILLMTFSVAVTAQEEDAAEKATKIGIKDPEILNIVENSMIFQNLDFKAIIKGEFVFIDEDAKNICAEIKKDDIILPEAFLEKYFDIKTDSLKKAAENKALTVFDFGSIVIVGDKNLKANKTLAGKISKLFGVYAAPTASGGSGTPDNPCASFEVAMAKAKENINAVGVLGDEYHVYFRGGEYIIENTIAVSKYQVSGTKIVYEAYPGEEPTFTGAKTVYGREAYKVTDPAILSRLDGDSKKYLYAINLDDYGVQKPSTTNDPNLNTVYYGEAAMTVARYPDAGVGVKYTEAIKADATAGDPGVSVLFDYPIMDRWSQATNAWIQCGFVWQWYKDSMKAKIDTSKRSISTSKTPAFHPIGASNPMIVYNLLEEITAQLEYYIDPEKNILYFFPYITDVMDGSFLDTAIRIPYVKKAFFNLNGVRDIAFRNLNFAYLLARFMDSTNGADNIKRLEISGCSFKFTSEDAIAVQGAYDTVIQSNDLYQIGKQGIIFRGGSVQYVRWSNSLLTNNILRATAQITRTNCRAFDIAGCGFTVSHNEITEHPHYTGGVTGSHVFYEYNEVYDTNNDYSHDAGAALHSGRQPYVYDIHVRYNYFHDLPASLGTVYWDDDMPKANTSYNIFYNTGNSLFVHGGSWHVYENNMVIDQKSSTAAASMSSGPEYRWDPVTKKQIPAEDGWGNNMRSIDGTVPEYYAENPDFQAMVELGYEDYGIRDCIMRNNVSVNGGPFSMIKDRTNCILENNIQVTEDIGFVDKENKNFNLKEDAKIFELLPDFKPIPFDEIGIYVDEFRTELPSVGHFDMAAPYNTQKNVEASNVSFQWKRAANTNKYRFILASDRDFKNIIEDVELNKNYHEVKNLRYGKTKYYWRVEAQAQGKNMVGDKVVKANTPYFMFETALKETVDKSDLVKLQTEAQKLLSDMTEGNEPGQYFEGIRKTTEDILSEVNAAINNDVLSQRRVDSYVVQLQDSLSKVKGSRNPLVRGIEDMMVYTDWSFQPNRAYLNNGEFVWTRTTASDNNCAGYNARKLGNHEILRFDAQLDNLGDSWMYFGLRQPQTTGSYRDGGYLVFVKKDLFELQVYGGEKNFFKEYPNEVLKEGQMHHLEFGAVDTPEGNVYVTFKVDGKLIIEETISGINKYAGGEGYFTAYMTDPGVTVHIKPTQQEATESEQKEESK